MALICRIAVKMYCIRSLVGASHFAAGDFMFLIIAFILVIILLLITIYGSSME